ncbi:hypothetical protein [Micromonospora peucetia]|uniref:Uncharacterized protein n=1 Tax=Micromonospora peucetia TaxID=47871 RepID=A0A1C6UJJ4_9ACTN|nr:hypothetical protein [Micromonospora peucetia]SCL54069.1 hypothetical protein GA0070608_1271 [Micromonospora peucetia]
MSPPAGRDDNRTGGPTRPFAVTEDELEQAVREAFTRRVAVARPFVADPAGLAIRRADRARRRQMLAGVALAAVATVTVSAGMAQLGQQPGPPTHPTVVLGDPYASPLPGPAPHLSAAPRADLGRGEVDLILDDVLVTAGGLRLALPDVGPAAERAQRLPDGAGWAVVGAPTAAGRSLWIVLPQGAAHLLLAGAREIVLSPDSRQVAWREGTELVVAGIVGTQVVAAARTPASPDAVPVAFAGDTVLIRPDPGRSGHALWRPAAGPPRGVGDRALHVYGARPDGLVVALVSAGTPRRPCVALLDPARDLAPVRTACGPTLNEDGPGGVSADGRWLLANGKAGREDRALLVDLDRLAPTPTARPAGPPLAGPVAWTPQGTAHYSDAAGALVRVEVSRVLDGEAARSVPVNGLPAGDRPVPVGNDHRP